jgi:hypothetical protein
MNAILLLKIGGSARFLKVVLWEFFGCQKIFAFFWSLAHLIMYNRPSPLPAVAGSRRCEFSGIPQNRHFTRY